MKLNKYKSNPFSKKSYWCTVTLKVLYFVSLSISILTNTNEKTWRRKSTDNAGESYYWTTSSLDCERIKMTPKTEIKSGFYRGACPCRNVCAKFIMNLLAKGIGNRWLKAHLALWGCFLLCCKVIMHHASSMLGQLVLCQYSIASRITTSSHIQQLFLLIFFIFLSVDCSHGTKLTIRYEDVTCRAVTCRKGYEVVPCEVDRGNDTCRLCPPDRYMAEDNVTSHDRLYCYRAPPCQPDVQRSVFHGEHAPYNPPVCECDTSRNYYQPGSQREVCKRRICRATQKLTLHGVCVCKSGRRRDRHGNCVWRYPEKTTLPNVQRDLSTTNSLPPTTKPSDVNTTIPVASSEVMNSTINTTAEATWTSSTTAAADLEKRPDPTVATGIDRPVRPYGDRPVDHSSSLSSGDILTIVAILSIVVVPVVVIVGVRIILKNRERSQESSSDEERAELASEEPSKQSGNSPEGNSTQPATVINVYANNAQVGYGNTMQLQDTSSFDSDSSCSTGVTD